MVVWTPYPVGNPIIKLPGNLIPQGGEQSITIGLGGKMRSHRDRRQRSLNLEVPESGNWVDFVRSRVVYKGASSPTDLPRSDETQNLTLLYIDSHR
jgi:hypothetical protein